MVNQDIAVLYLRMSDERQERSISEQRCELLRYAKKHGYRILREYTDSAISGDDTARRAGFLRMREDAQQG
jgi:DNA invertase Pin-like site-specific DNA recombinase